MADMLKFSSQEFEPVLDNQHLALCASAGVSDRLWEWHKIDLCQAYVSALLLEHDLSDDPESVIALSSIGKSFVARLASPSLANMTQIFRRLLPLARPPICPRQCSDKMYHILSVWLKYLLCDQSAMMDETLVKFAFSFMDIYLLDVIEKAQRAADVQGHYRVNCLLFAVKYERETYKKVKCLLDKRNVVLQAIHSDGFAATG